MASGHTHRHATRRHRHVVITETGSPKDHPGTWTGYVVYEGGLRQVVRRVGRGDAITWTEHTRRAAGGAWGYWSPGRLDHRLSDDLSGLEGRSDQGEDEEELAEVVGDHHRQAAVGGSR